MMLHIHCDLTPRTCGLYLPHHFTKLLPSRDPNEWYIFQPFVEFRSSQFE